MNPDQELLFSETQSFLPLEPVWNWVLVGLCAVIPLAIGVVMVIARVRYGKGWPRRQWLVISALMVAVFFAITTPILALLVLPSLTIEVHRSEVTAQLWPFQLEPERFSTSSIRAHYIRTYSPTGEFGGWGIRQGRDGARAYNARGNVGVQLVFHDGSQLLLGSQRSLALNTSLQLARSRPH